MPNGIIHTLNQSSPGIIDVVVGVLIPGGIGAALILIVTLLSQTGEDLQVSCSDRSRVAGERAWPNGGQGDWLGCAGRQQWNDDNQAERRVDSHGETPFLLFVNAPVTPGGQRVENVSRIEAPAFAPRLHARANEEVPSGIPLMASISWYCPRSSPAACTACSLKCKNLRIW